MYVVCKISASCSTTGSVRLVGTGSSVSQGRVEICYNHQWGTVCDYTWDINAAIVVCRQLGYNGEHFHIRMKLSSSAAYVLMFKAQLMQFVVQRMGKELEQSY